MFRKFDISKYRIYRSIESSKYRKIDTVYRKCDISTIRFSIPGTWYSISIFSMFRFSIYISINRKPSKRYPTRGCCVSRGRNCNFSPRPPGNFGVGYAFYFSAPLELRPRFWVTLLVISVESFFFPTLLGSRRIV